MSPEDQITELAYISRGLAYVMSESINNISTAQEDEEALSNLYSLSLVLCEKLDSLSEVIDEEF